MAPRPASHFLRLVPAAVLALMAPACGDGDASGPVFPVRHLVAQAPAAQDELTLMLATFEGPASLDGWWLLSLDPSGPALQSAAHAVAAGRLTHADGSLTLPPRTALLRRISIERSAEHVLTARLRGPIAAAGEACTSLILVSAADFPDARLFGDDPLRAGDLDALVEFLRESTDAGGATWRQAADGTSFASARRLGFLPSDEKAGRERMIALFAAGEPLEIDQVRLLLTPQLRHGYDPSTELPKAVAGVTIEGIKIAGEWRLSAFVPPNDRLRMPMEAPREAVDLVFGACPDPKRLEEAARADPAAPPSIASWTVRLQPGDRVLAAASERLDATRPLRFVDHVVPWPPEATGAVTLEFEVQGAAAMVFGQPKLRGPEAEAPPSLLFISIDTLRADHLGFLGYERPTSPFLDELAAQGAVFTDVTAVSSYTLPTHATLFTGLFPPRHMALDTTDRLNTQRTPTLAMLLAVAGYHTAGFTGGGFVSVDYGFAAGFDRYTTVDPVAVPMYMAPAPDGSFPRKAAIERARAAHGLREVAEWIERQGKRRWFAFLHTFAAHDYDAPAEDRALFVRPSSLPEDFDAQKRLNARDVFTDPPTREELDRLIDLYDATIHHVDRRLRQLIEPLRQAGLLDHTWIVVTSDHGEEFAEHGRLRHHGSLYEELVRVPLLVVPPGGAAPVRVDEPVSQADLLPTLLELLGEPVPSGLDGRSLAPWLGSSRPEGAPTPIFSHVDRTIHGRSALRLGPWKIVRHDTGEGRREPAAEPWELFDLRLGDAEQRDLEQEHADEFRRLRELLEGVETSLAARAGERSRFELDDELRARLVELGYVEASR